MANVWHTSDSLLPSCCITRPSITACNKFQLQFQHATTCWNVFLQRSWALWPWSEALESLHITGIIEIIVKQKGNICPQMFFLFRTKNNLQSATQKSWPPMIRCLFTAFSFQQRVYFMKRNVVWGKTLKGFSTSLGKYFDAVSFRRKLHPTSLRMFIDRKMTNFDQD